jgi:hypothetical protein
VWHLHLLNGCSVCVVYMSYAVCGMQYSVCGMRYAVCGMRYAVCGMLYGIGFGFVWGMGSAWCSVLQECNMQAGLQAHLGRLEAVRHAERMADACMPLLLACSCTHWCRCSVEICMVMTAGLSMRLG